MGHAIDYITVEKKPDIMKAAQKYAYYNADPYENESRSYHGNMTIHNQICDSYEDAMKFIERHDTGWYSDHAVQYKDKSALKPTKQMESLKERADKMAKDRAEYQEKHAIKNRKSEFAGCKKCGSKIAVKYMSGDKCPVCGNDLRAEYVIERVKKYNEDIYKLDKQYAELKSRQNGKCPIKWLVKVEVHC